MESIGVGQNVRVAQDAQVNPKKEVSVKKEEDFQPTRFIETPYKCPVCQGTGLVSIPPNTAGDILFPTIGSSGPWPCRACGPQSPGIIWRKSHEE